MDLEVILGSTSGEVGKFLNQLNGSSSVGSMWLVLEGR